MKQLGIVCAALCCSLSASAYAANRDDEALVAARQKIFGVEHVHGTTGAVRNDKVLFSWLGHMTGAVSFMGRVIMTDAYLARVEVTPGRTPYVIKDVVDMRPEALFISHGHGDHADNAAFIAAKTGATLYMSTEACETAQTALARMKADPFMQADPFYAIPPSTKINCIGVTAAGSVPATELVRIRQLDPSVCILGFRALHSVAVPADPDWGLRQVVDTPDPNDAKWFPPGVPLTPTNPRQPGQQDLRQGNGPGGTDQIDYQFIVRSGYHFTMMFSSSVGAFKEGKGSNLPDGTPADGKRLLDLARALPNTDLLFTTLSSGNTDDNAWRDHVYWTEAVRPKILTTGHVAIGAAMQYYAGFLDQLKLMEQPRSAWPGFPHQFWPVVRNHTDPTDILKPEVYEPFNPIWFNTEKQRRITQYCGGPAPK